MAKRDNVHPLGSHREPSHVKPLHVITINDNEEVRVTTDEDNYRIQVQDLYDSALKCTGCQEVSIHQLTELMYVTTFVSDKQDLQNKRLTVCTYCGKATIK